MKTTDHLDILMVYQGKVSEEWADEVRRELDESGSVKAHAVKLGLPTADQTLLSRFEELVSMCDGAIALVAEDPRPASAAGNVWFEIGYWIARRSGAHLLVVAAEGVQAAPTSSPSADEAEGRPPVGIISNLLGWRYVSVDEPKSKEIGWVVQRFVEHLRTVKDAATALPADIVEGVLRRHLGHVDLLTPHIGLDKAADSKIRVPLNLVGQLLGLSRATHLQLVASALFSEIAVSTHLLWSSHENKSTTAQENRTELLSRLADAFEDLGSVAVLQWERLTGSNDMEHLAVLERYPGVRDRQWGNLVCFLASRVMHHDEHRTQVFQALGEIPLRNTRITRSTLGGAETPTRQIALQAVCRLLDWGARYVDEEREKPEYTQYRRFGVHGLEKSKDERSVEFWDRLVEIQGTATKLKSVLVGWSWVYSHKLKQRVEELRGIEAGGRVEDFWSELARRLPHNSDAALFDRTWIMEV